MPKGENLHEAILNELYEFSYEVEQIVQEELDKGAQDLKNELKATSPKRSGRYAKNWKVKKNGRSRTVYNGKPTYRVTHLLEYGHASRGGGRKVGAIPHIKPAEDKYAEIMHENIKRRIGK